MHIRDHGSHVVPQKIDGGMTWYFAFVRLDLFLTWTRRKTIALLKVLTWGSLGLPKRKNFGIFSGGAGGGVIHLSNI